MSYDYAKQVNESQFGRGVAVIFDARNIGHLSYYVTATPMNSSQWNNARLVIKEKTDTYVVVAAYDINSADANADTDFEFMICGQN